MPYSHRIDAIKNDDNTITAKFSDGTRWGYVLFDKQGCFVRAEIHACSWPPYKLLLSCDDLPRGVYAAARKAMTPLLPDGCEAPF